MIMAAKARSEPSEALATYGYERTYLNCEGLLLDMRYQRRSSENRVRYLAENWDERLAGCIRVNRRRNGQHYVMDGGHRLAATKQRGVDVISADVYEVSEAEEAVLFKGWNTHSANATPDEVFKARCFAQEPKALDMLKLIDACGFDVVFGIPPQRPDQIRCVRALESLYDDYQPFTSDLVVKDPQTGRFSGGGKMGSQPSGQGPERLQRTLRTIKATWPDQPGATHETIVRAVDWLWKHHGNAIDWPNFARKLGPQNPQQMARHSMEWGKLHHHSAEVMAGQEMLRIYNLGKRTGRVGDREVAYGQY